MLAVSDHVFVNKQRQGFVQGFWFFVWGVCGVFLFVFFVVVVFPLLWFTHICTIFWIKNSWSITKNLTLERSPFPPQLLLLPSHWKIHLVNGNRTIRKLLKDILHVRTKVRALTHKPGNKQSLELTEALSSDRWEPVRDKFYLAGSQGVNGGLLVTGTKVTNKQQDFVRCLKTRSPNLIQKVEKPWKWISKVERRRLALGVKGQAGGCLRFRKEKPGIECARQRETDMQRHRSRRTLKFRAAAGNLLLE